MSFSKNQEENTRSLNNNKKRRNENEDVSEEDSSSSLAGKYDRTKKIEKRENRVRRYVC